MLELALAPASALQTSEQEHEERLSPFIPLAALLDGA